jgi:hypothetical protein
MGSPFFPLSRLFRLLVYAYDTVEPGHTMVELHSNFTFEGSKIFQDGMYPTNHQLHETIEITHGFTDWFETGFYISTSEHNGQGIDWVGLTFVRAFAFHRNGNGPSD